MAEREAPPEVFELAEARSVARRARDFARADALRADISAAGWTVVDDPGGGFTLAPALAEEAGEVRLAASDVLGVLDDRPNVDVSVHWVCEGWPEDIDRAAAGFRMHAGARSVQYVVADVTGEPSDRWGGDVEVVRLRDGTGWAEARNAGLRRSRGRVVLAIDGSIEPVGDVFEPIERALHDAAVGVVGPFGIVTRDLREFEESSGPGPCDAIEGYLMAFRRELLVEAGGFDERFRWYRAADIEWSFRVRDAGFRAEVVEVPVAKHEHRTWTATPEAERARLSKRNFNRFLDRWRDRWDLVLAGEPGTRETSGGVSRRASGEPEAS